MQKVILFVLACVIGLVVCFHFTSAPTKQPETIYDPVGPLPQSKVDSEAAALVSRINARNEGVHSFQCTDIQMRLQRSNKRDIKLRGEMYYQKPLDFRVFYYSILGKECDMGSNNEWFWYWTKRTKHPGFHFATHAAAEQGPLNGEFTPVAIMKGLGFFYIDLKGATADRQKNCVRIVVPEKDLRHRPVRHVLMIDPVRELVVGDYIYGTDDKLLISKELTDAVKVDDHWVPKEQVILDHFTDQSTAVTWRFNNPQINVNINPKLFVMPTDLTPRIDLSR